MEKIRNHQQGVSDPQLRIGGMDHGIQLKKGVDLHGLDASLSK